MQTRLLATALMAFILGSSQAFGDEPRVIKPEEARNHVGETCSVTFKVRHTKHGMHRKTYFLDSREEFRSPENLGVQNREELAAELRTKNGIDEPHRFYADKTIRVVGKIFLQEDRPYLTVEKVEHITIIEDAKSTAPHSAP